MSIMHEMSDWVLIVTKSKSRKRGPANDGPVGRRLWHVVSVLSDGESARLVIMSRFVDLLKLIYNVQYNFTTMIRQRINNNNTYNNNNNNNNNNDNKNNNNNHSLIMLWCCVAFYKHVCMFYLGFPGGKALV